MDVRPVDPRDIEWGEDSPAYRVYFWRRGPGGYEAEEFLLAGVKDVHEVLRWSETNAEGREATVYAVVQVAGQRGVIRLAGTDPTAAPEEP